MATVQLDEAVAYASAIINAADWITVNDVVLDATNTITSATAAFTQNDVSKWFSIAGGLSSNKPLIGYIVTVNSATEAVLSVIADSTGTDFSMSFGGRSEDPRHPLWKITRAVLQKDLEICQAILSAADHPRRNFFTFTTSSQVQNNTGVPMPSRSGDFRMVEVQGTDTTWRRAKELPAQYLNRLLTWLNNKSGIFTEASEGYFVLENEQIYFTGTNVRVTYANISASDACQAPSEYSGTIALLAAADIFATEGDDLNATQALSQIGAATAAALIAKEVAS